MTEGNNQEERPTGIEKIELKENDRIFQLLEQIENGFQGEHLIVGGLGVQGTIGKELRVIHDIDICIPIEQSDRMVNFLESIGFEIHYDDGQRLLNSGIVLSRDDLLVDLVFGDMSENGLTLKMSSGRLFIPSEGLDNIVKLRGIAFKTFSPEVHYFIKNRAVSRNPFHTINALVNRKQDEIDFQNLKKIINSDKAKLLLERGFAYVGRNPIIDKLFK